MAFANRLACFVISSCSSRGYEAKMSYFVPIRTGIAVCWVSLQYFSMSLLSTVRFTDLIESSSLPVPLLH